jgi:serine/threonine protein kinase
MPGARGPAGDRPRTGDQLGPYRLLAVLGEGRMGVVYRARRGTDGEIVALKVLRDELVQDELYRHRFRREARIASALAHEHVVSVVDFGEASGRLYIAARYVRGFTLSEQIASEGALSLPKALRLAGDLTSALEALHLRGLVHRDVKPGNVMIDERGAAALTDFGLARGVAETVMTKTGAVVGTLDYLAPEVIRGEQASPASDIYALGCLLYECLAGAPPYAGKEYVETLLAHVRDEPRDLGDVRDDLPAGVSWAILRALAKDPGQRPPTATAYARLVRASAQSG